MKKFAAIVVLTVWGSISLAAGGNTDQRVDILERKMQRLEARLQQVERQLSSGSGSYPYPYPEDAVCTLVGKYSKVWYLGKGANNLDAEYNVRKACQESDSWGATGCTEPVSCEQAEVYGRAKTCLLTGTYSKVIYRGTGMTKIEAVYAARKECQSKDSWGATGCQAEAVCSQ